MNSSAAHADAPVALTPTIIKICGITRLEDGLHALGQGADWLGFIRWPKSPRYRPADTLADLITALRARADVPFQAVGVYVDADPAVIAQEVAQCGLDRVQLHGRETPDQVAAVAAALTPARPLLKVLRVRDAASLNAAGDFPSVDLLADTDDPALPGGTGRAYDYHLLQELIGQRRVLIAGGLTPANVGGVVAALRPFGVDVSSGVELSPGVKDHAKVATFIQQARAARH
jgi:phosphoribosylanthranilate isomerase